MKKITMLIVFAYLCAALAQSDDNAEEETAAVRQETAEENGSAKIGVSKKPKNKIVPVISLNNREITISAAGVNVMKIAIFSLNGKKLSARTVIGDKTAFTLPKSAKNAIIVQIDADRKFFSQKVMVE